MNLKSNMLKILVVFALILMIIPAIAAEDTAQDDEAVAESDDVVLSESGADDSSETSTDTADELQAEEGTELEENQAAGEPAAAAPAAAPALAIAPSGFLMDFSSANVADVAVIVTPEYQTAKTGDIVVWAASFINLGPEVAKNAVGQVSLLEGNIAYIDSFATYFNNLMDKPEISDKIFDPVTGIFDIGDMGSGDIYTLYIIGQALDDGEAILSAAVFSDSYDPNPSNNVDFAYVNYAGEQAAAAEETLPAAGNPIAMALLALISIVGLTFGRRL